MAGSVDPARVMPNRAASPLRFERPSSKLVTTMIARLRSTVFLLALTRVCLAELPRPEELLPDQTLAVLSVPDVSLARSAGRASNLGRLWQDPAMGPFREKFEASLRRKWAAVLRQESGLDPLELYEATRGQATLAWFPSPPVEPGVDDAGLQWLLILDARESSNAVAKAIGTARAHLATNSASVSKSWRSGDLQFTSVTLDLQPAVSGKPSGTAAEALEDEDLRWELCFGQVGSAFVAGPSWSAISNALPGLTATNRAPGLASKPSFARAWNTTLKDRVAWAFLDVATLYQRLSPRLEGVFGMLSLLGADPTKVVPATGLASIRAVAAGIRSTSEGERTDLFVEAPAAERAGLTRLMEIQPLEAGLLEGVPEGVASFHRWRIDGPAGWKALEGSLQGVSTNLANLTRITVESAGQVFDPNFNLQRDLVGALGNDFITFTLPPTGTNLIQLSNPGRVQMVGSPDPTRLVAGWKALEALVHMKAGALEFSQRTGAGGRRVVVATVGGKSGVETAFQITTSSNHVVIASDAAAMDAYLAAASRGVPSVPGLTEALVGSGGGQRGVMGFSQPRLAMRAAWESLRSSESLAGVMPPGTTSLETVQQVESWADFKSLPPFETIARYWTIQTLTGGTDAEGFRFRWFSPRAP
jgi:hypothetical protein